MGFIKATIKAVGGTLKDQWKEAIRCENMPNNVLMIKKTTETGVITNGSIVIVEPGQCAIVYENGKLVDAIAEEGIYVFDSSTSPSFFSGPLGDVFDEMKERFTYNGMSAKQQSVYYFNIKEIIDNKFGTTSPVPFQDWSHAITNQMTGEVLPLRVNVKCFGKYTFKITNPSLFMENIAGTAEVFTKEELVSQMRSEVIGTFQKVLNKLGHEEYKIPVLELPSQTDKIKDLMRDEILDDAVRERGVEIVSFIIESVVLDQESMQKVDAYELSTNTYMQQGTMVDAYARALKDAAKNGNGAVNGFAGIGILNNISSNGMTNTIVENNAKNSSINSNEWECPSCKTRVTGKFCSECGTKKPE